MSKYNVQPGEKYGLLTVIGPHTEKLHKESAWHCRCDCGEPTIATASALANGKKKSCGCLRNKPPTNTLDLKGRRFGKLTAIERAGVSVGGSALWRCTCDCGGSINANATHLRRGDTVSCGCARPEQAKSAREILADEHAVDGVAVPLLKRPVRSDSKSGIKGVHRRERRGKVTYEASITVKGKRMYGGAYADENDAIAARKRLEDEYHAPFIEALEERKKDDE
ncbi:hypothetical protein GCM10008915_36210 [Bifidobacterium pullorum subsp. gallinarum]